MRQEIRNILAVFSPRMRGCFDEDETDNSIALVLPAYAGMFPRKFPKKIPIDGSPRVCGDVSQMVFDYMKKHKFSPRMRGCFSVRVIPAHQALVLPAYAGMFPHRTSY